MKTKLTELIILASLFLTACKPQNAVEPYIGKYTELMADTYCNYKCDYPKTLDELVSYMQSIRDEWMEFASRDTIQVVLSFLENGKNDITWIYCHPTLASLTIRAIYKDDTLFYKTMEWYLPCIDDMIRGYIKYHLEYPKSLNELLHFDSIGSCQPDFWEPECWKVTRNYLLDNRDSIVWEINENGLFIKAFHDTVAFRLGKASDFRCCAVPLENNTIVFTDSQGKYDYREETRKSFLLGLKSFRKDFLINNQCDDSKSLYMVEYRRGIGFSRFCENENFSLDTKWFREMEKYVSQFAQEHELERILFYTRVVEVK